MVESPSVVMALRLRSSISLYFVFFDGDTVVWVLFVSPSSSVVLLSRSSADEGLVCPVGLFFFFSGGVVVWVRC